MELKRGFLNDEDELEGRRKRRRIEEGDPGSNSSDFHREFIGQVSGLYKQQYFLEWPRTRPR